MDEEDLRTVVAAAASPHPQAKLEEVLLRVQELLARQPTVPERLRREAARLHRQGTLTEMVIEFPLFYCPFRGCLWEGVDEREQWQHLLEEHGSGIVEEAMMALGKPCAAATKQVHTVINAAIAIGQSTKAPLVCYSHDRRSCALYHAAVRGEHLQSLICVFCGCAHPCLRQEDGGGRIAWRKCGRADTLEPDKFATFCGLSAVQTKTFFGVEAYLEKYGRTPEGPNLAEPPWCDDLLDWQWTVPFPDENVHILAAAEDLRCPAETQHVPGQLCPCCEVPVCEYCETALRYHNLPTRALANDLWTGYAPSILYETRATYLELLLASPYVVSLVCFVLEVQRGNVLREPAQMHRHRVGASRGQTAPGLVLNRSVSPGDPTHCHQSRYPKSRLGARTCAESIGFSR